MQQAKHDVALWTLPDGSVRAECWTNDDEDRGYPNVEASWTLSHPSVASALKQHGKCRVGISGVVVTVTLDGEAVR